LLVRGAGPVAAVISHGPKLRRRPWRVETAGEWFREGGVSIEGAKAAVSSSTPRSRQRVRHGHRFQRALIDLRISGKRRFFKRAFRGAIARVAFNRFGNESRETLVRARRASFRREEPLSSGVFAMLNDDEKAILSRTWADALVVPNAANVVADLFFERLLALRPSYTVLFLSADLPLRKERFIHGMTSLVKSLDWPEAEWLEDSPVTVDPVFNAFSVGAEGGELAGMSTDAFPLLGEALVWALENALGDRFTKPAKSVWTKVAAAIVTALRLGAAYGEALAPTTRRQLESGDDMPSDTERFSPLPPDSISGDGLDRRIVS
jgi:hypothetical protein